MEPRRNELNVPPLYTNRRAPAGGVRIKLSTVDEFLGAAGLTRCSECPSWILDRPAARSFHARRCSS